MPFDMTPPDNVAWYVLAIESVGPADPDRVPKGQEWAIRRRLRRACIEHHMPVEEIRSTRGGGRKNTNPRLVPFLPGYIFVHGNVDVLQAMLEGHHDRDKIKGALKLLRGAEVKPRAVPKEAIEALIRLEDKDGKIRIRRAAAQRFREGAIIRFIEGNFSGIEADVEALMSGERLRVRPKGSSKTIVVEADRVVSA